MAIFTEIGRLEEEQGWRGKSKILLALARFNTCI